MEPMGGLGKTVVVSGYYGFANSGDEAVLHAILTALRAEAKAASVELRVIVLSGNPAETARIHQVEAAHRMRPREVLGALRRADAVISGGGSLLQDVTSGKSVLYYLAVIRLAQLLRKPVYVYAQGIGPIHNRSRFGPMIRSAFRRCRFISVRDAESKELLTAFGLEPARIEVVPDPVMGMGAGHSFVEQTVEGRPKVGVSVRYWREDREELSAIADSLLQIAKARSDAHFTFLPFHLPSDREASEWTAERLLAMGIPQEKVDVHPGTEHPSEMLRLVGGCDVLIGMRLHSLIYAATVGVPPVGVSYDPKIDQFVRRLGESPAGSTDALSADALADAVLRRLEQGKHGWYAEHRAGIEEMQENSRRPAQQIFHEFRI